MGCTNLACFLAGIRSYNEAKVRLPSRPSLASGCTASSNTWYSNPMAEPTVFSDSVTKYLTPLLAPLLILNSNDISKALYCASVIISPPLVDSPPLAPITESIPFSTFQPLSGKGRADALRQPLCVVPSNKSFQPLCFSYAD